MVGIWIGGGNKEGIPQELLATTRCVQPSNGWNITMTTMTERMCCFAPSYNNIVDDHLRIEYV